MTEAIARKGIVRQSFSRAHAYHTPLRAKRGANLVHLLHDHIWLLPEGPWLDLGCSTGDTLSLAAERELIADHGHFGIDLSPQMISKAHSDHPDLARWMIADFFNVPLPDESLAGIISNSSLQWALWEDGLDPVLEEMRRLLPLGAPLGLVLSGPGLPSAFLDSYKRAYQENPAWHSREEFCPDPLAGPRLEDMISSLEKASFVTLFAETSYETFSYANTEEYLGEIESSWCGVLLAPFQEVQREAAWEEISSDFLENAPSPYLHHSLATYIIARAI